MPAPLGGEDTLREAQTQAHNCNDNISEGLTSNDKGKHDGLQYLKDKNTLFIKLTFEKINNICINRIESAHLTPTGFWGFGVLGF